MLRETNQLILSERRDQHVLESYLRVKSNPWHPLHEYIIDNNEIDIFRNKPNLTQPFYIRGLFLAKKFGLNEDKLFTSKVAPSYFPWKWPNIIINEHFRHIDKANTLNYVIRQRDTEFINGQVARRTKIYTVGSKSTDGTAFGVYSDELDVQLSGKLPDNWSVYSSEIYAIIQALKIIKESSENSFIIFSDSLSALEALKNVWSLNPLIQRVLKKLDDKDLMFCWIPSHVGLSGNEKADELARSEVNRQFMETRTSFSDEKNLVKQKIREQAQREWHDTQGNKFRKIKDQLGKWVHPSTLERVEITRLMRLRSGHTRTTHEHIFKKEPAPICQFCSAKKLSIEHLLSECTALKTKRDAKGIRGLGVLNGSLQQILNAINFFQDIGIWDDL